MIQTTAPSRTARMAWRLSYLTLRFLRPLTGEAGLLRILLRVDGVVGRLSFEEGARLFGDGVVGDAFALSPTLVRESVKPGDAVLDIGCGSGRWVEVLDDRGASVIGIDTNAEAIERLTNAWPSHMFICADAEQTAMEALGPGAFDLVILSHVVEHLADPLTFLQRLTSVTSYLLIEVPDYSQDALHYFRFAVGVQIPSDADHEYEFSADSLQVLLHQAGLRVERSIRKGGTCAVLATLEGDTSLD